MYTCLVYDYSGAEGSGRQQLYLSRVEVEVFPLEENARPLQDGLLSSTRDFLRAVNQRSAGPILDGIEINERDRQLLDSACTLHGRYKALIIPVITDNDDVNYQIRGIHLTGIDMNRPQLALFFNSEGELSSVQIFDETARLESWNSIREDVSSLDRGVEVLDLIKELEEAYNIDALAVANGSDEMPNLSRLLQNAEINVSKLKNGRPERVPYRSSNVYISRLVRLIQSVGSAPQITYELVNVYPHRDSFGEVSSSSYRVTLIQHWMFPPGSYIDTDYVSLDIELNTNTFVRSRNAGRGSFSVNTNPDGIKITEYNSEDWSSRNIVTPFTDIINAPWQFHYVTLENVWYEKEVGVISPDDVLNNSEVSFDMRHLEGQIALSILPDIENATISVEDASGAFINRAFENGDILTIPLTQLKGIPDPNGRIESDDRQVRLRVIKENYEPVDTTITLPSPGPRPVVIELERLTGQLAVTSTPEPSEVLVDNDLVGQTPFEGSFEVTDEGEPLSLSVQNANCLANDFPSDCVLHIPSDEQNVQIVADSTTRSHIDLSPFVVRDLAESATINVQLNREDDALLLDIVIEDEKGRDRKYVVDFELQDRETWKPVQDLSETIVSCSSESSCVGNRVRPGQHIVEWDMSDAFATASPNTVPVLTLRRKGLCWPCVLVPAAAGVAAAYVFREQVVEVHYHSCPLLDLHRNSIPARL